jgi:hypothetical protein
VSQPEQTKDRVVRVFISSTFRDMFRERDVLAKRIFQQLRRLCEERFFTWSDVDPDLNTRGFRGLDLQGQR